MTNSTLREFNDPINSLKSAFSFIAGSALIHEFEQNVQTFRRSQRAVISRVRGIRFLKRIEGPEDLFHAGSLTCGPKWRKGIRAASRTNEFPDAKTRVPADTREWVYRRDSASPHSRGLYQYRRHSTSMTWKNRLGCEESKFNCTLAVMGGPKSVQAAMSVKSLRYRA